MRIVNSTQKKRNESKAHNPGASVPAEIELRVTFFSRKVKITIPVNFNSNNCAVGGYIVKRVASVFNNFTGRCEKSVLPSPVKNTLE